MTVLERFGVDVLDEALYRALLVEPEAPLERLAAAVGMDVSRLPGALARLAELGLVLADGSATCRYSPQAPQYALELLIQREEQRLELERLRLHEVRATMPDLVDEYVALRARILGPEVEVLDDAALVRARLFQLHREAKSSAWAIHPGGPLAAPEIDQALPLDQESADRNVETRLIVSSESLGPEPWRDYLISLMDLGQQLRVLSSPPLRCVIVDRKHAVIPGPGRNGDNGAYVLHGPHLVSPIVALFESLWVQAQPLVIEGKQSEVIVTEERMRQVSALLSAGMKDEAVARRLSISVRTVRRVIAATMQTLHADSRWQAGALAARQGWDGAVSTGSAGD